jgi:anamorsin
VPLRFKRPASSGPKKRLNLLNFDSADIIDESTLLEPKDFTKPIIQPPECAPAPGKRRKACKDCTCGLKEQEESENADARKLPVVTLGDDEFDFTVQGKTSSCGSCSLGDAFRCAGCPFIGMPAFKPGEEVRLLREAARWADDI